ncbi:MAG: hypothetical protein BWK78_03450 [Thiotrichaceae bacterium IS1]|nr:MAG: hypothetical protein BWK78_03450 [Thiotrichaceae bacterium IS1]
MNSSPLIAVVDASVGVKLCVEEELSRMPITELLTAALDISLTYGTTVYDGCYVALAQRLAIPCVTADKKLVNIFANQPGFQIYWLGNFLKPDEIAS